MKDTRTNSASWSEKQQKWIITVQRDGDRRRFTCSDPTKKGQRIANAKADKWLEERTTNETTMTSVAIEKYIEKRYKKDTERSRNIKSLFNKWFIPVIGDKKVGKLKVIHFQDILDNMNEAGRAYRYMVTAQELAINFVKFLNNNDMTRLTLNKDNLEVNDKAPVNEKGSLQPDEIYTLFTDPTTTYFGKIIKDRFIHLYRFIVVTGFRRGETVALKEDDILSGKIIPYKKKKIININNNTYVKIDESINRLKQVTKGKNKRAERYEVLSETALKILEDQRELVKSLGIRSEYIFPSKYGNFVSPKYVYERFKKYAEYHNFEVDTLHELRHTFVSLNEEIDILDKMVGHGSEKVTQGYIHPVIDKLANASTDVDKRMNNVLEYGKLLKKYMEEETCY